VDKAKTTKRRRDVPVPDQVEVEDLEDDVVIQFADGDDMEIFNGGTLGFCRVLDTEPPVQLPEDMGGAYASRRGQYALVTITAVAAQGRHGKAKGSKGARLFNRGDIIAFDHSEFAPAETFVPPESDEDARTLTYYYDSKDPYMRQVLIWTTYLRHKSAAQPDTAKKAASKKAASKTAAKKGKSR
jgi:hypothetical protein